MSGHKEGVVLRTMGSSSFEMADCMFVSCASCLFVALHGFCCLIMDINSTLVALHVVTFSLCLRMPVS